MIPGLRGSLLSHDALERLLESSAISSSDLNAARAARLRGWHGSVLGRLGPACGARAIFDQVAEPLARELGYDVSTIASSHSYVDALLSRDGRPAAFLVATSWGASRTIFWRHAVYRSLADRNRWCICVNGQTVCLLDAERTYARRYAEFDLAQVLDDDRGLSCLWALLRASSVGAGRGRGGLDDVVDCCERHRTEVRITLRDGVHEALLRLIGAFRKASPRRADSQLLHESLTVVYRMLFLLFAEARALVPRWHPVYERSYTLEALRAEIDRRAVPRGTWEALQAIARLAHRGCRAGALRVPPFNGRLFSPADAPLADCVPLDDEAVARSVSVLTTRQGRHGRERISYADLGVEQLGAVYEHLLEFDLAPGAAGRAPLLIPTGRRKASGSFYTPRSLTEFLVRRTLAPLVQGATPDGILALRVLDPAMGSGAFLVAACRFLASAYENALVEHEALLPGEFDERDRADFRRAIAQRCLFGVDVNPTAVQLGRLSLWLATMSADKPLTFLDHHLRPGNSLVGASIEDVLRQPSPGSATRSSNRPLPLLDPEGLERSLTRLVGARLSITATPDDTIEQVRGKERALARLGRGDHPLHRWRTAVDLWCASWFGGGRRTRGAFLALVDEVLGSRGPLPAHVAAPLLSEALETAGRHAFFHWPLEFPEIFFDERGAALAGGGFDAVIGNPPWEMLRGDDTAAGAADLVAFARGSGIYRLQGRGHANLYQLFVERTLQLTRPGGRAGLVLPWNLSTDQSCGPLRRHVFDRTSVDTFTVLENRKGIFPIHRSIRFVLTTLTTGGATRELPTRTGVQSADELDRLPDTDPATCDVLRIPRRLLDRISGEDLAVPDIRAAADLEIVSGIVFRVPACGDPEGWELRFGRELNATEDRAHFAEVEREGPSHGLPVVEGKQIGPFVVDVGGCRYRIRRAAAERLLDRHSTFGRPRLAYREVAASTNRLTLIAAIVPPDTVTTHTVFCLKTPLDSAAQHFLCAVFNSYVANYLVRMRVSTHVTAATIARLPVPRPSRQDKAFTRLVEASATLAERPADERLLALVHATAARLYGLSTGQFAHVLSTFPLIPEAHRAEALGMFTAGAV